jgi:hypothetical protein
VDSIPVRADNLSNNVANESNIEVDSIPIREYNLSSNVANESNIEVDSIPIREDNLSSNVANDSNIEVDSISIRASNLNNNVANDSNIEVDSIPIRADNLSSNVINNFDLSSASEAYRTALIALNNFQITGDNLVFSEPIRQELLSKNTPSGSDILSDTELSRKNMMSRNPKTDLGFNVEGFGTQAFVGLSRNLAIGAPIRLFLMSRNKYRFSFLGIGGNEYGDDASHFIIEDSNYVGINGISVKEEILKQTEKNGQDSLGFANWNKSVPLADVKSTLNNNPNEADVLMAKNIAGNPFDNDIFIPKNKSVIDVINRISNEASTNFAKNYQRNQDTFIVGDKNGEPDEYRSTWSSIIWVQPIRSKFL